MQLFFNQEAHKKQWYPCYDFNLLQENYYYGLSISDFYLAFEDDQIVGITGVWDQRRFKQTTVNSYTRSLKLVKPFINLISKITKGFELPKTGKILNYFTIHAVLIKGNNRKIFKDIIEQSQNSKGLKFLHSLYYLHQPFGVVKFCKYLLDL